MEEIGRQRRVTVEQLPQIFGGLVQLRAAPWVEILLMYHLLFNIPIESLFERQKQELKETIGERIKHLIEHLKSGPPDSKVASRIAFIESALNRLSSLTA